MTADLRPDLQLIARHIPNRAKVLDIGCDDGALLEYLVQKKKVDGRGIELNQGQVSLCVSKGLSVIQGDADNDLAHYPDQSFDVVVLSVALQMMHHPKDVLEHMVRIGERAIVAIPNFAHWKSRWHLLSKGRMPVTDALSYQWYETPNIHFCTIRDFIVLAREMGLTIEKRYSLDEHGHSRFFRGEGWWPNLFSEKAVFVLRKQ